MTCYDTSGVNARGDLKDIGVCGADGITLAGLKESGLRQAQSLAFVVAVAVCLVSSLILLLPLCARSGENEKPADLETRINPNEASFGSMVRLPGIGPARANAIIEYRETVRQQTGRSIVFEDCNDLKRVKGIGPVTAAAMGPYLKFD